MRKFFTLATATLLSASLLAQKTPEVLPHYITVDEVKAAIEAGYTTPAPRGDGAAPDYENIRCMAEWEESRALVIGWEGFSSILKRITAAARLECEVIIMTENPSTTEQYLLSSSGGGAFDNLDNVTILETPLNSIWVRDYAAKSVYADEVGDFFMVDWIYNRPRPNDDNSPYAVADYLNVPIYGTTNAPYELMGTGGNFMSDGFGTGFSSELIVEENSGGNTWWDTSYPNQGESGVLSVMNTFLGIEEYVLMPTLPYDGIHHIDMHMKLLDEETLLIAEYPDGVADGPQINANLEYVLSNYTTKWGTPFKVIRIPSPPSTSGLYPDDGGWYRTYTNSLFVNKTVLVPTYYTEYDTTALRIYEEALPGYTIVGIDCDTSPNDIISLSGALHCITHEVGADNPLLISHQPLNDTEDTMNDYEVVAYMNHRNGVVDAKMFYKTSLTGNYTEVQMTAIGDNNWQAFIPSQAAGTTVYYYVWGESQDGKTQVRPMPAPEGYWEFDVFDSSVSIAEQGGNSQLMDVYPNPASAITVVPVNLVKSAPVHAAVYDVTGRQVNLLFEGVLPAGEQKLFFDAGVLASGVYSVVLTTQGERHTQKLVVR